MKNSGLTKQGVRNLDPPKRPRPVEAPPVVQCEHKRMHCDKSKRGHWSCPDCGLNWDDSAGC